MIAEYLGQIGYKADTCIQGFLVSIYHDISHLKAENKKIVLFGVGENGFYAEKLLDDIGIDIYCYADNSEKKFKEGCTLRGKKVYTPYDLFEREDIYFIIAVGKEDINCARLQFMTHQIEDYSIFLPNSFWHFSEKDVELRDIIMESINMICFKDEEIEKAIPYQGIAIGRDGKKIGFLNALLHSTIQSGYAFLWEQDMLKKQTDSRILEIGPRFGLMSLVLLKQFEDIVIDWIIFGECGERSQYKESLDKIVNEYPDRINRYYGYVERDEFVIRKTYDLIILTEVFEHFVLNPVNILKKIKGALSVDGRVILTTPAWGHVDIYKTWKDLPDSCDVNKEQYLRLTKCGHIYQYSKDELMQIFEEAGLTVKDYAMTESGHHNFILSS